jgi:short-subunit dehydrogenase
MMLKMNRFARLMLAATGAALAWWLTWPELAQRRASRFLHQVGHRERRGVALITGASSGIGAAFARRLAQYGYDLVLVARRRARLEALADELHHVTSQVVVADLAIPADIALVASIAADLSERGQLDLLINNAGFGTVGRYADLPLKGQMDMLNVHIVAALQLIKAALPGMLRRGRGGIINVASIAGWYPLPGNATYSASKRFLVNFSESLQAELDGSGVYVQALCPGFTYSEFHDTEAYRASGFRRERLPRFVWQTAEAVAEASLNALGRQVVCVPGVHNRALVLAQAPVPRAVLRWAWQWMKIRERP